ncbi:MAG: PadR family transcriptional regulator [Gemmatimonadota bacterium]|jgi:transcriptional regulator
MAEEGRTELLQGTLDMLVLKVLALEPMHGWGISERLQEMSRDVFLVNQGSLYPALQRLRRRGLVVAEWRRSENNRRARYYSLTGAGLRQLAREVEAWERAVGAVQRILGAESVG